MGYFLYPSRGWHRVCKLFLHPIRNVLTVSRVPEKSAKPTSPKSLKVAPGDEAESFEASLQRREFVIIGRARDCDVVIQDPKASRQHCKLTRREDGFMLEDLGSRNGTYVDGKKISEPLVLKANQAFKVGDTIFYLA